MRSNRFKRGLVLLLMMVLVLGISQMAMAAENVPSDVAPSHWAYKAVCLLVDKGYLQLYQDQTFKGEQPVDRYTLAVVVAKVLNEISSGRVGTSKEDVALLKSLTTEFRNELVDISTKGGYFNKKLENLARQDQVIKEDLAKSDAEQAELQRQVQDLINGLTPRVQALEQENSQLKVEITKLKKETGNQKLYILAAIVIAIFGAVK